MQILKWLGMCCISMTFILLAFPNDSYAQNWYYPMDNYVKRQTVKNFGQLIDNDFYIGKESLFPFNRFYGYHAGADLEAFVHEKNKNIPVYVVYPGMISYIGNLSGYGGVILLKLDNQNATALYGHVKVNNLKFKKGDHISIKNKPFILTYLGDEFSDETSKERKHLHFGIYKGTDLYFKGHENNVNNISEKWINPLEFLRDKNAMNPIELTEISISPSPSLETVATVEKNSGKIYNLVVWLLKIFKL